MEQAFCSRIKIIFLALQRDLSIAEQQVHNLKQFLQQLYQFQKSNQIRAIE